LGFRVIAFSHEKHNCPAICVVVCKLPEKLLLFLVVVFSFLGDGRWDNEFGFLKGVFYLLPPRSYAPQNIKFVERF